jgi:gamma-glutamyltranspeptidase/glutathione hydrolase
VSAWGALAKRHCTWPLGRLLEPAIALAADDTPTTRELRLYASREYASLIGDYPALQEVFGEPQLLARPRILRQPALARSLAAIASGGIDAFYGGQVAQALAADAQSAGAILSLEDLAHHRALVQEPLMMPIRLGSLFTCPPNTQGLVLIAILEGLASRGVEPGSGRFPIDFLAAKREAFAYRDRVLGDPEQTAVAPRRLGTADTTCFVVIDRFGNAVSWMQSLFDDFGSGVLSPNTGIVLQNRLSLAHFRVGEPGALTPFFRPPHTLCPAIVVNEGAVRFVLATPGGHGQAQTLAQIITALEVEPDQDLQALVEAPRFCQEYDGEVLVESRLDPAAKAAIEAAGFGVRQVGPWGRDAGTANALGAVLAISVRDGIVTGAADPRRDGYAVPAVPRSGRTG